MADGALPGGERPSVRLPLLRVERGLALVGGRLPVVRAAFSPVGRALPDVG